MRRLVALAVAAALVAGGCGKNDPGMTEAAASALAPHMPALRQLAEARDGVEAARQLAELRAAVQTLLAQNELTEARATAILDAATGVEQNFAAITPTTTASPPTVPPVPSGDDGDRRKGKGRGDDKDDD